MSMEFWQSDFAPYANLPEQWAGLGLLGVYVLALGYILVRNWGNMARLLTRHWVVLGVGLVLAPVFSTILSLQLPGTSLLPTPGSPANPTAPTLAPLAYVPVLLAGGWMGVVPAMMVAAVGGLARGLWDTHRLLTAAESVLAAGILVSLLQQDFRGWFPRMLRHPLAAALAAGGIVWPISFLAFLADSGAEGLPGLDHVIALWVASALPLFSELALAGLVGELARWIGPSHWVSRTGLRPPPYSASLNRSLLYALVPLAVVGIVVLFWADTRIAINVATELVVDQMVRDAQHAADGIPFFVRTGESLVLDLARGERLLDDDPAEHELQLSQGIRTVPFFRQLVFFDAKGISLAAYPQPDVTRLGLTGDELAAVEVALKGVPQHTLVFPLQRNDPISLSLVAPVIDPETDLTVGALLGRADIAGNPLMLPVINSLQGLLVGSGSGFITDDQHRIIFHPDASRLQGIWEPIETDDLLSVSAQVGRAYRDRAEDGTRRLVYYLPVEGHPWHVVIVVPNSAVLAQATQITVPLALFLLLIGMIGIGILLAISSRLTRPLGTLAAAAERITKGEFSQPVEVAGQDEVGRLGQAFERMRVRLRTQLDELSLLLQVSQAVAGSLSLNDSLPPILQGALSATQAAGIRLLLTPLNDFQGTPHSFEAGVGTVDMVPLDAEILALAETEGLVAIANLARARAVLDVAKIGERIQALIALPLSHEKIYLGVLWLGYDRPHTFTQAETDLLATLAGQAVVAVANARLFQSSEGDRRQLAAILTSTPDAVIVIDRRARLLLMNPAAAAIFEVDGQAAVGCLLSEVIHQPELLAVLRERDASPASREVPVPDGRTFSASASPIVRADGSVLGRLAVLRDVTHFKHLNQLKSDAVAAVSHDLKTSLSYMRGYATMLPMVGSLNVRQQEFSDKLMTGIEQMSKMIDDLLSLYRIESGVGVAHEPCHVDQLTQTVVKNMQAMADGKSIDLQVDMVPGLPPVLGDEALLRQAISNLVDNALKYTPSNGRVQVMAGLQDGAVMVTVKDIGVGISRTDQARVFERFYRVKGQESTATKGSGLGLAFVKSITERHGGRVWVASQLGQGSTFYLTIPIKGELAQHLQNPPHVVNSRPSE